MLRSLSVLCVLAGAIPAQQSSDVAMGLFPFLVGNMDGRTAEVTNACATRGIETLYVSVFRATGASQGDLWISDPSGTWNPAWGPVRPGGAGIELRSLIAAAHARDMRVVAVLKCFDDTVQPTDANHRAYLLSVIDWLLGRYESDGSPTYDLDGLALDYVRFVGSGTGNNASLVTNFVADVKRHIGALSLHAYLIANRYTFDGPVYDGNFASYASVRSSLASQFGQDWEQMAQWVDVLMPMCYTADGSIYSTYARHQAYVRQAASYCRTACNNVGHPTRRVCPVVRTYTDTAETTTVQTIDASITGALQGGANGYQAFRYGTMQAAWWPVMQQYAAPGCNFPIPVASTSVDHLSLGVDPSASRDQDQAANTLDVAFDWNSDGVLDTAFAPLAPGAGLATDPSAKVVGIAVRDAQGHVSATRRRIVATAPLGLAQSSISANQPVNLGIDLHVGAAGAGHGYVILASLSGGTPGASYGGIHVPLNLDAFTEALFSIANSPVLPGAIGVLDASGDAHASFVVPAGLLDPLRFRVVNWCAVGATPSGQPAFASNPSACLILP
ncbi:MAG: alpha-amylase family protein [Planctomycetota bacterium]